MVSNIWNSAQSKIWDLPENLRGYFGLVEGLPGVGKSFAIAALALYLNDMGCCVIISAPTHGAADGNTQKILDRQNLRFLSGRSRRSDINPAREDSPMVI